MNSFLRQARFLLVLALRALPRGGQLPVENWRRRHIALSLVLAWHVPVLLAYGMYRGHSVGHSLVDVLVPAAFALAGVPARLGRALRAVSVATGLITCSVLLVHLSHGLIEAHFHFFVMVALLTLYQDWKAFLVAIALTVVEHGVTGVVAPHSVYNHPDAWEHPWRWAFVHGAFVVAASAASIAAWAMSEADHRRMKEATTKLHTQRVALLSHEAHHDALTGLPNRRMVLDHLEAASRRSAEAGRMLGVLFIDLDRFKQVNDTYGHLIGDVVLKATADRLRSAVRGVDMAARLGGDEFVVVYEGLTDADSLAVAKERVQRALAGPLQVDDEIVLTLEASIGHVLTTSPEGASDLIERADLDMYRVKHLRRGEIALRQPR